jgi:UDP-N-acetylmuramate dehydrogenase
MLAHLKSDVSLLPYSWWKIGGVADYFVEVENQSHLQLVVAELKKAGMPFCVIGQGTNLLFDDAGYRGCVIRIGAGLSRIEVDQNKIKAEAGCWVPKLACIAARRGLSGLQHTVGIPASFGGLICMNGGSQRKNIAELIESVTVLNLDGDLRIDPVSKGEFAYRKSRYQRSGEIVISAVLSFEEFQPYELQRFEMLRILRERNRKFPRKMPSCGSVFKSSPELYDAYGPPGKVIEELGFKGKKIGRIQVSPAHANFIVNTGGGSSADVLTLVHSIHSAVKAKTGLSMQPEFLYLDPVRGLVDVI